MKESGLDDVDLGILFALQEDARHNTNADISERVGVSASTVGKRIAQLEERGIINGYHPEIDYEEAGFPLQVLFLCTAPIGKRETLVQQTLAIDEVIDVREMMTGERNVHIQVVGRENDDITRIAQLITDLGYRVNDEILVRDEYVQPSALFRAIGSGE